jgi:hypothetical protein
LGDGIIRSPVGGGQLHTHADLAGGAFLLAYLSERGIASFSPPEPCNFSAERQPGLPVGIFGTALCGSATAAPTLVPDQAAKNAVPEAIFQVSPGRFVAVPRYLDCGMSFAFLSYAPNLLVR